MHTVGLRAGPDKINVPIKSPSGIKTLAVNPQVFKQLSAKTPSLRPSLLSPKERVMIKIEDEEQEKKNEIIIASSSKIFVIH